MESVVLYFASDHRGFDLKRQAMEHASGRGVETVDLTPARVEGDDYPAAAELLAKRIAGLTGARGFLACGSGTGIAIAANRFKGIRAACGLGAEQVAASRRDDDVNVLVIGADYAEEDAVRAMLDAFLDTAFDDQERHVRRLEALDLLGA